MDAHPHITLIGCGKMGGGLLHGWLDQKIVASFSVVEPYTQNVPPPLREGIQGRVFESVNAATEMLKSASLVVLAVKPQNMAAICAELKDHISENTTILSIAAGQSLASFAEYFENTQPVIRAMPNTPAAIGKGMSVAIANAHINNKSKALANTLLKTAGKLEWVTDESLLDAVTALSGSGPAYVFYLIEMLTAAGENVGLPGDLAETLARETVIGAAALADADRGLNAETLRENVTSPGGTTAAALSVLMDGRAQALFNEALQAATTRSRELNS